MLSGRKAFPGEDVSEVLAAVLKLSPDWDALPASRVSELVRRCLEKDPRKRRRDIGDVRNELEVARDDPSPSVPSATTGLPWRYALPLLAAVAVLASGVALWTIRSNMVSDPEGVTRFVVEAGRLTPADSSIALSPGGMLVYAGHAQDRGLHRRSMGAFEWETVA